MIAANDAAWLATAVNAVSDAVFLIDPHGRVVFCNPACEHLFGWSKPQIIGHDADLIIADWSRKQRSPRPDGTPATAMARHMDGSRFSIELTCGDAVCDGTNHHLVIARRQNPREPATRPAESDERSFRLLVEGVTDYAIYMLDCDGLVTSWNRGAEHIKQFTAAEILGHHFREFYPQEARVRGEPENNLAIAREQGRYEATAWRLRKDGSRFWAHVVIEPLRDEHGDLIGFAKVTSDITERRRAEQVIREADERINTLIDTVGDGVILTDRSGVIRTFNVVCQRLFGYTTEEVIGYSITMLMPQPAAGALEAFFRQGRHGGPDHVGSVSEAIGRRRDGSHFPIELSVGETVQDDERVFVAVIHDLTERKRTEEQLVQAQKMESVGQLSGGIAHDFNNLLTVILGNAEFLGDQLKARQDLRALALDIGRAGQRGAELTQRLLAFSRRQTLKPVELDCNALLDSMNKLLGRTLREDITIDTDFDPALHPAFADRAQLESAIINLAVNARDAMEGGGRLSITTANVLLDDAYRTINQDVRPGDYVMIAVTDNGTGMPKDVLDRAFEPFYTTKEVGKGSGLGLSMVYGFAKQSNGHVSIYSEPGLGTTVRLYLPALLDGSATATEPNEPSDNLDAHGEIVLIVEDDPFVRSYAVMCLRNLGYVVIAAVDGKEAIQKLLSDTALDVLFTDIVMPGGINGWELAEAALARRPGLRILLTSGYALDSIGARSRGHADFPILAKPYRKADLARRLRDLFATNQAP